VLCIRTRIGGKGVDGPPVIVVDFVLLKAESRGNGNGGPKAKRGESCSAGRAVSFSPNPAANPVGH
jgi:hypothetical protein